MVEISKYRRTLVNRSYETNVDSLSFKYFCVARLSSPPACCPSPVLPFQLNKQWEFHFFLLKHRLLCMLFFSLNCKVKAKCDQSCQKEIYFSLFNVILRVFLRKFSNFRFRRFKGKFYYVFSLNCEMKAKCDQSCQKEIQFSVFNVTWRVFLRNFRISVSGYLNTYFHFVFSLNCKVKAKRNRSWKIMQWPDKMSARRRRYLRTRNSAKYSKLTLLRFLAHLRKNQSLITRASICPRKTT